MPVKSEEAIQKMRDVIRRKHFSLSTEASDGGWLKRDCSYIKKLSPPTPSERKIEQFLMSLLQSFIHFAFHFYKYVAPMALHSLRH